MADPSHSPTPHDAPEALAVREILTVGHSTHGIDEFVQLLKAHGARRVVDVRTVPRSRHNPQFNREELSRALHNRGLHYRHMKALGGLRHARKDSPNMGWENASFRGYADYMQTEEFERALEAPIALAAEEPTAIMCAEAVPWRGHRSLIADALKRTRRRRAPHFHPRQGHAPHSHSVRPGQRPAHHLSESLSGPSRPKKGSLKQSELY